MAYYEEEDYDPKEDLLSEEAIETFLEAAYKTHDLTYISHAMLVAAQARGTVEEDININEGNI